MLAKLANLKKLQEAHRSGQRKPGSHKEELNSEDQASPSGLKPSGHRKTFTPLESTISSRNTQQSKDKGASGGGKYADGANDRELEMANMKLGASQKTPRKHKADDRDLQPGKLQSTAKTISKVEYMDSDEDRSQARTGTKEGRRDFDFTSNDSDSAY